MARREDYICIDCGKELGNEDCPTCAGEPSWIEYLVREISALEQSMEATGYGRRELIELAGLEQQLDEALESLSE
tara:strand:- start:508 stop:732 length:225 start_codon:yes stop_codon:yes gene_type:complete